MLLSICWLVSNCKRRLDLSRVIGPMKQGLALTSPAIQIARPAIFLQLRNVPSHGPPSSDLP